MATKKKSVKKTRSKSTVSKRSKLKTKIKRKGFVKVVVDFARHPKTIDEIFNELVRVTTHPEFYPDGEFKKIANTEFMCDMLDINKRQFKKYLMFGVPYAQITKKFLKDLNFLIDLFDIETTKLRSDTFDRNTFNLKSFLSFFGKKQMSGNLYSKSQIYAVMNSDYIIPAYNFAVDGKKMKTVKEKMFKEIKRIISQWQSMEYFYFNFLIIEKYVQKEL